MFKEFRAPVIPPPVDVLKTIPPEATLFPSESTPVFTIAPPPEIEMPEPPENPRLVLAVLVLVSSERLLSGWRYEEEEPQSDPVPDTTPAAFTRKH